jgi:hypothetical protein
VEAPLFAGLVFVGEEWSDPQAAKQKIAVATAIPRPARLLSPVRFTRSWLREMAGPTPSITFESAQLSFAGSVLGFCFLPQSLLGGTS